MLRRRWQLVVGLAARGPGRDGGGVPAHAPALDRQGGAAREHAAAAGDQPAPGGRRRPATSRRVDFFQDQVKFLESRSLAARVIRELGLEHEPDVHRDQQKSGWCVMSADPARAWGSSCVRSASSLPARARSSANPRPARGDGQRRRSVRPDRTVRPLARGEADHELAPHRGQLHQSQPRALAARRQRARARLHPPGSGVEVPAHRGGAGLPPERDRSRRARAGGGGARPQRLPAASTPSSRSTIARTRSSSG